jgi:hypothetical protein
MVVAEMLGVVKLVAVVDKAVPPVATSYQSTVIPPATVAESATVPVPHLEPAVPVGAVGNAFTVAITAVLVNELQPVVALFA